MFGLEIFALKSCEPRLPRPKFQTTSTPRSHPPAGINNRSTLLRTAVPQVVMVKLQPTADQSLLLGILHHCHHKGDSMSAHWQQGRGP